ncbi:MAG: TylF/MycF/NovP-related O-methyltransferase [Candidatus Hodarchaeales archaeon]
MHQIKGMINKILIKLFGEKGLFDLIRIPRKLVKYLTIFFSLHSSNLPKYGRLTYDYDGIASVHNCDFITDSRFVSAYSNGMSANYKLNKDLHIEWRAYVACWAADHVRSLEGDYVECGCYTGILTKTVVSYINFEKIRHKKFFLFDSFKGISLDLLTENERKNIQLYKNKNDRLYGGDFYEITKSNFSKYENIILVKGYIPDSLSTIDIDEICYLSIDMNAAFPETEALKWFWNKLTPGAIVLLDDYGFHGHNEQKTAIDSLGSMIGFKVLSLPTGQGLIVKKSK